MRVRNSPIFNESCKAEVSYQYTSLELYGDIITRKSILSRGETVYLCSVLRGYVGAAYGRLRQVTPQQTATA
jgi:hypothetical protein